MHVEVVMAGARCWVSVHGDVDIGTAPELHQKLTEVVAEGCLDITLDLNGVGLLDSVGLGVLVGALKRVRTHGGKLSLVCDRDEVLKVFRMTGLQTAFDIRSSKQSTVAARGTSMTRTGGGRW